MPRIAEQAGPVTGGVDTHADVHVAAVVDQVGRVLGTRAFPADTSGYAGALAWMRAHGDLAKVGVEGTGSYGCGLARRLAAAGVLVVEVIRPNRQARRQRQVRCRRRGGRGAGRPQRRGVQRAEEP
jgi:transposase